MRVTAGIVNEQLKHFKYLGSVLTYGFDNEVLEKLNKFQKICGNIHRKLKNIRYTY